MRGDSEMEPGGDVHGGVIFVALCTGSRTWLEENRVVQSLTS